MNIGIFTDTYFPQISGVATSVKMLDKELTKLGHKVYIFTTSDPEANNPTPRVFRIKSMPFVFFPSRRIAYYYSPRLVKSLKYFKLDLVHTQTEFSLGFFGKAVAELYRIPHIHTYHTMYEDYVHYIANGHLIRPKTAQTFSKFYCNHTDMVITPVEKSKHSLLSYGVTKPIEVVPTGLDFSKYEKSNATKEKILEIKKELGINPDDPIVLSLGRISKEKSVDVIVREMPALLRKIPNAKLVIVGDGPMLEDIKELVKETGIEKSVVITGSRPWEEIGKYYQLGDVFVSASCSETQGLTYIEAMIAKVPLVVKRDESLEGIVFHKKTGYFFERDEDFAEVCSYALSNKEESKKIAEQGYKKIQGMSSSQFAKNLEEIYASVIEANNNKPKLKTVIGNKLKITRILK